MDADAVRELGYLQFAVAPWGEPKTCFVCKQVLEPARAIDDLRVDCIVGPYHWSETFENGSIRGWPVHLDCVPEELFKEYGEWLHGERY